MGSFGASNEGRRSHIPAPSRRPPTAGFPKSRTRRSAMCRFSTAKFGRLSTFGVARHLPKPTPRFAAERRKSLRPRTTGIRYTRALPEAGFARSIAPCGSTETNMVPSFQVPTRHSGPERRTGMRCRRAHRTARWPRRTSSGLVISGRALPSSPPGSSRPRSGPKPDRQTCTAGMLATLKIARRMGLRNRFGPLVESIFPLAQDVSRHNAGLGTQLLLAKPSSERPSCFGKNGSSYAMSSFSGISRRRASREVSSRVSSRCVQQRRRSA